MNPPRLFQNPPLSTPLQESGYLRLPDVLRLIPVSKSTWWLGVKTGRYPASIKLGERITAWRVEDIQRCMADLTAKAKER